MEIMTNPIGNTNKADEVWERVRPDLNPYPEARNLRTPETKTTVPKASPVAVPNAAAVMHEAAAGVPVAVEAVPIPETAAPAAEAIITQTPASAFASFKESLPSILSEILPTLPIMEEITQVIESASAIISAFPGGVTVAAEVTEQETEIISEVVPVTPYVVEDVPVVPSVVEAVPMLPAAELTLPAEFTNEFGAELEMLINDSIERSKYYSSLCRLACSRAARNTITCAYRGEKRAEQKLRTSYYILMGDHYCPDTPSAPIIYNFRDGVRAAYLSEKEAAQTYLDDAGKTDDATAKAMLFELADGAREHANSLMKLISDNS